MKRLGPDYTAILFCFSCFLPSCLPPIFLPLFYSVSSCSFPPLLLSSVPHECPGSAAFLSHSRPPTTPDLDLILSPAHVSSFSRWCPCWYPLASPVVSSAKYFKSTALPSHLPYPLKDLISIQTKLNTAAPLPTCLVFSLTLCSLYSE